MEENTVQPIKKCSKCGATKQIDDFYQHRQMGDGHLNKCKSYARSDVADNRAKNIEKIREYDRERGKTEKRKKVSVERIRKYRKDNPDMHLSHVLLSKGKNNGLISVKPCAVCGTTDRIEAHHFDYSKPLEVVWLCSEHHKAVHYPKIAPRVKQIA